VDYFLKLLRQAFSHGMQEDADANADADELQETSGSSRSLRLRGIIRMAAPIIGAGSKRCRPPNRS